MCEYKTEDVKELCSNVRALLKEYKYLYETFDPEGTHAVWVEWEVDVRRSLRNLKELREVDDDKHAM